MNTDVKTHSTAFGWVGLVAVAVLIVMWIACVSADPAWTWGEDNFSHFGICDNTADIFTYGMVIFGVLLAIYGVGRLACGNGYAVGGAMLILAGIGVALIGTITSDFEGGDYHRFVSILTAIFIIAAIFAILIQQYYDGHIIAVGIGMVLILTAIVVMLTNSFESYETLGIILAVIWLAVDSVCMVVAGLNGGKQ